MAEDNDAEKTEEPTARRLEDAIKRGQFIQSKEITNFLIFLVLLYFIISYIYFTTFNGKIFLKNFIENSWQINFENKLPEFLMNISLRSSTLIMVPLLLVIIVTISSYILQNGRFAISFEPLQFDLSRISILKGLGRLFSLKSVIELLKGILKMFAASLVAYLAVKPILHIIFDVHEYDVQKIADIMGEIAASIMIAICILMAFIAGLDYFYQRYNYFKDLKMTKQEVKEEYKQSEGNPEIKARMKAIRRERVKKGMLNLVPNADVVIMNPTHYAIVLKYEQDKMAAPECIAKGMDNIALIIKNIAEKNNVPIIHDKPLARILYPDLKVGEEIPIKHYQAVAEVIKYIYNLKK